MSVYQLRHERKREPPPGADPGRPLYGVSDTAVRKRLRSRGLLAWTRGYPPWARTRNLRVQSAALLPN